MAFFGGGAEISTWGPLEMNGYQRVGGFAPQTHNHVIVLTPFPHPCILKGVHRGKIGADVSRKGVGAKGPGVKAAGGSGGAVSPPAGSRGGAPGSYRFSGF